MKMLCDNNKLEWGGGVKALRCGMGLSKQQMSLLWTPSNIDATRVITKVDENYENQICSLELAFIIYFIILKSQLLFGAFLQ